MKALLFENIHDSADPILRRLPGADPWRFATTLGADPAHEAHLAEACLLGIRSRSQITQEVLDAAPGLLAVGCFCIGTNQVDLDAAAAKGVPVFNAPFANTRSVAELTLACAVLLQRRIPEKATALRSGAWQKSAEGAREVRGKTLGIVGYGNIGSQLGVLADAMGMQVIFYDVESKLAHGNAKAVGSLDELLETADVVTLHVPSTPSTRGMIDAAAIGRMRTNAVLINHARGDLVDIDALYAALDEGRLAGAAIDVFPAEPKSNNERFDSPLTDLGNVILTPHIGGSTLEAQANIGEDVASKLVRYVAEGGTKHAVNLPELEPGPLRPGRTRVLSLHRNEPGFLSKLNDIIGATGGNVAAQHLQTKRDFGYAAADIEGELPADFEAQISAIHGAIRTRLVRAQP